MSISSFYAHYNIASNEDLFTVGLRLEFSIFVYMSQRCFISNSILFKHVATNFAAFSRVRNFNGKILVSFVVQDGN